MHLGIATALQAPANIVLHDAKQPPAPLVPEHHARRFILKMKQLHGRPQHSMVAALGFLEALDIRIERLPGGPGGAIDPGELGVLGVAPPVGTGDLHELGCLE